MVGIIDNSLEGNGKLACSGWSNLRYQGAYRVVVCYSSPSVGQRARPFCSLGVRYTLRTYYKPCHLIPGTTETTPRLPSPGNHGNSVDRKQIVPSTVTVGLRPRDDSENSSLRLASRHRSFMSKQRRER